MYHVIFTCPYLHWPCSPPRAQPLFQPTTLMSSHTPLPTVPKLGRFQDTPHTKLGVYRLDLQLGGAAAASLIFEVICPPNKLSMPDGECGCPEGHEPEGDPSSGVCAKCPRGHFKGEIGNQLCAPCAKGHRQPALGELHDESRYSALTSCQLDC